MQHQHVPLPKRPMQRRQAAQAVEVQEGNIPGPSEHTFPSALTFELHEPACTVHDRVRPVSAACPHSRPNRDQRLPETEWSRTVASIAAALANLSGHTRLPLCFVDSTDFHSRSAGAADNTSLNSMIPCVSLYEWSSDMRSNGTRIPV